MKSKLFSPLTGFLVVAMGVTTAHVGRAQSRIFGISTPGDVFSFAVTNVATGAVSPATNPTLDLSAGATYRFGIGTSTSPFPHPVVITTDSGSFPPSAADYSNAAPQNIFSGTILITIPPTNFPTTLYYRCNVHGFTGIINIHEPPPPNEIVSVSVTTNVILISTGTTNTWVLVPEFSSNLLAGAWSPVPGYTNFFAMGTNLTAFDRLEPLCGPNVFLRVRQSPPP